MEINHNFSHRAGNSWWYYGCHISIATLIKTKIKGHVAYTKIRISAISYSIVRQKLQLNNIIMDIAHIYICFEFHHTLWLWLRFCITESEKESLSPDRRSDLFQFCYKSDRVVLITIIPPSSWHYTQVFSALWSDL